MAQSKFDICTRALQRIGANSIDSFDDGITESDIAGQEYSPLVENLLTNHRWKFARKRVALNHLIEEPVIGWTDYWQLPSDLLDLHGVFISSNVPIVYERDQDKIACDYDENHTLYAVYTASFAESFWPAYFVEVVTEALEAVFWRAIVRNPDQANQTRDHLEKVTLPKARNLDSQQQTARKFPPSRLNAVRRI